MRLRARLTLLTTPEGGRRTPILTGYRPNFRLHFPDGRVIDADAQVTFVTERIRPGESGEVMLEPSFPSAWGDLVVGSVIKACEGRQVVGESVILERIPD